MKICVEHPLKVGASLCGTRWEKCDEVHPLGTHATCKDCVEMITKILNAYRRKAKRK